MDLAAIIVSFLGAVVAFFYKKEGGRFSVGLAGLLILAFLCLTFAINLFVAYQKGVSARESSRALALSRATEERMQSALMMQYVDLPREFDHANLNFTFSFSDSAGESPTHPLGENYTGLIRKDMTGTLAIFDFHPQELPSFRYVMTRTSDGGIRVKGGSAELSISQEILFDASGWPPFETEEDTDLSSQPRWFFETLAWEWGEGMSLPTGIPAVEYISKILQQQNVGTYVLKGSRSDSNLRRFIKNNLHADFRFVQSYYGALGRICNRVAYVPLSIHEYRKSQGGIDDCGEGDICLMLTVRQPMEVVPCELSKI